MLVRFLVPILLSISALSLQARLHHASVQVAPNHQYWFNKKSQTSFQLISSENFCPWKCLYLENYVDGKDFVVVVFKALFHETFSACYVKIGDTFILWNKIITNTFFEEYCGDDTKDWMEDSTFSVSGVFGVGIGTQISEDATDV